MHDYQVLIAAPRFRGFWFALLCNNLGSWCVIATIPILVAERFGAGMVLVLSLGLRIVPKVILAPIAGGLLRRFGAARVASTAMLAMAVLTAALPRCNNLVAAASFHRRHRDAGPVHHAGPVLTARPRHAARS